MPASNHKNRSPLPSARARATLYLIPSFLDEHALQPIPPYVLEAVKECRVFFVENERSARRYLKALWKEMVIDDYEWFTIHKAEQEVKTAFMQKLKEGKTIGLISEAGCPGVADPGQLLTAAAHQAGATIRPLVGPSSILLALMASGMNGQQFRFCGYLPVDSGGRTKAIRDIETESQQKDCTQIFIETPYRNNQLLETLLQACHPSTRLCIAVNLTAPSEFIRTRTIAEWKEGAGTARTLRTPPGGDTGTGRSGEGMDSGLPDLHKQPAIFCLYAGGR
jgi:16S rRNA (cytidine1402-2'-O)-methyltransferase